MPGGTQPLGSGVMPGGGQEWEALWFEARGMGVVRGWRGDIEVRLVGRAVME